MHGAIPPLPQYVFTAWCSVKTQAQLYLILIIPPCMPKSSKWRGVAAVYGNKHYDPCGLPEVLQYGSSCHMLTLENSLLW
jgi:hypothetical protein